VGESRRTVACLGILAAGDLGYVPTLTERTGIPQRLPQRRPEPAGVVAAARPGARRLLARWLLPPLLAFLLVQGLLLGAATAAGQGGQRFLDPSIRRLWDAGQYVTIAGSGYTLQHCDPQRTPFEATDWCGSAGWFPLYPALLRVGHQVTGWDLEALGWGLAELLALGVLVLVWWLLGATVSVANLSILGLAAVFPGSIYDHTIFPISLCTFASLACLGLLVKGRWVVAGLAGAVAAAAYPLGAALVPVVAVWLLAQPGPLRARLLRGAAGGGLVLLGLGLVAGVMQRAVGHWNAYLMVQSSYGNGLHNPVDTFRASLLRPRLWHLSPEPLVSRLRLPHAPQVELVLVLVLVGLALWTSFRRRPLVRADLAVALFTVVLWLGSLAAGGRVSQYRQYALLLPAVVLLRDLPRALQLCLLAVAAACTFAMATLFYVNMLI
jgi:hypothetical protein